MLRSMQLENFKAFGKRTVIPFAPITLIFGENSSGKSSILQALNLLKQTRESRDVEALLLARTESGFADLGSFQELLFDHDLKKSLKIRIDVTMPKKRRPLGAIPKLLRDAKSVGLEFSFSRKRQEDEITLEGFSLCGEGNHQELAVFQKCDMPRDMRHIVGIPFRSERRRRMESLRAARCMKVVEDPSYWQPAFEWSTEKRSLILEMLRMAEQSISEGRHSLTMRRVGDDDGRAAKVRERLLTAVADHIHFFASEFTSAEYAKRMIKEQLNEVIALDGFIPSLSGRTDGELGLDNFLTRLLDRPGIRRDWTVDVGASSIFAGRAIEENLGSLFPLGPFRKPPARWYMFTGTTPSDVGYQGHLLPDLLFRDSQILLNTNRWLRKLKVGYEIKLHHLGDRSSDLFELRLMDTERTNPVEVGLSDVGFGISQMLPLLVQSLAATDQIISVEQPEVHIHPRLQADLGDLLIEAIKEPRRNQFIIETHSEHLALRLQRRVRENELSADDISIVYVSRGPDGATVQPLRLDKEGDFMDDFPGGFFPERLSELR